MAGSVAKGQQTQYSDIDLVVLTRTLRMQRRKTYHKSVEVDWFIGPEEFFREEFQSADNEYIVNMFAEGRMLFDVSAGTASALLRLARQIRGAPRPPMSPSMKFVLRSTALDQYHDLLEAAEPIGDTSRDPETATYLIGQLVLTALTAERLSARRWAPSPKAIVTDLSRGNAALERPVRAALRESPLKERVSAAEEMLRLIFGDDFDHHGLLAGPLVVPAKTAVLSQ